MNALAKCFFTIVFSVLLALNSSAEAVRGSLDCEFIVKELASHRYSDGEFNHGLYYANIGGHDVLIVLCHGGVENGRYGIELNGQFRFDYSNAISELITYYNQRGNFRSISNVDIILLGTCHAGYASDIILPNYVVLPEYSIPMVTLIDYSGLLFVCTDPCYGNEVYLRLYTDKSYKEPSSRHSRAMSNFLGGSNGRGYRVVNEVVDIPENAIRLSRDF